MDAERFDDLLRSLRETLTRRGLSGTLVSAGLAVAFAFVAPAEGEAGKRRRKRRRKKRRSRKPHICQGRDACEVGENSKLTGCLDGCFCYVTANGKPLCGGLFDNAASCDVCDGTPVETICVRGGEFCGNQPFACVRPCPF